MFLKNAWIPAIAGIALMMGCESKPADTIPQTAPMAAKEPFELLPHMKYIAVRKDYKDIPVIAPQDLTNLYGNAWWFQNHAGQMDLTLTDEEIKALGVEEVKNLGYIAPGVSMASFQTAMDKLTMKELPALPPEMAGLDGGKLDKLPGEKDKAYGKDYPAMNGPLLRPTFNAGIYRLLKGIPAAVWNEVSIMKTTPNAKNDKETALVLGYQGKPILEMTARQKTDKTYGIVYIHYLLQPRAIAKMAVVKK
jgi:hypothetical protein